MSTYWETFYEKQTKPSNYDQNISNVEDFVRLHEYGKLVLVSVSTSVQLRTILFGLLRFVRSLMKNDFSFFSPEELLYLWNIIPFALQITSALELEDQLQPSTFLRKDTPSSSFTGKKNRIFRHIIYSAHTWYLCDVGRLKSLQPFTRHLREFDVLNMLEISDNNTVLGNNITSAMMCVFHAKFLLENQL